MATEILFHSAKGGVGKSTLSILATEYFLHRGTRVDLSDASGNPTAEKWIAKCRQLGREAEFRDADPEVRIRDTKGIPGSAAPFFASADLIVIPFQPFPEDVEESEQVFLDLAPRQRHSTVFVSNRLRPLGLSREQAASVEELREFIAEHQAGLMLPGLVERVAIYPLLLNGLGKNFFAMENSNPSFRKARAESAELFGALAEILEI